MPKQSADVTAGSQADASDLNNVRADALRMWASAGSELTIATGAVSLPSTGEGFFTIDTELDAASDDLDTISGGEVGEVIMIASVIASRVVNVVNGTGNIETISGNDIKLDDPNFVVTLRYDGANWIEISGPSAGTDFLVAQIFS